MSQESVELHRDRLADGAAILVDAAWELPDEPGLVPIPYAELASRPVFRNIALLGVIGTMLSMEEQTLRELVADTFQAKGACYSSMLS